RECRAEHVHEGEILRAPAGYEYLLDRLRHEAAVGVFDAAHGERRRGRDDVLVGAARTRRATAFDDVRGILRREELAAGGLGRRRGEVGMLEQLVHDLLDRVAGARQLAVAIEVEL